MRLDTLGLVEDGPVVKLKFLVVTAVPDALVMPEPTDRVHAVMAGIAVKGVRVNAVLVLPELTAATAMLWALPQERERVLAVLDVMASENVSVNAVLRSTPVVPELAMLRAP